MMSGPYRGSSGRGGSGRGDLPYRGGRGDGPRQGGSQGGSGGHSGPPPGPSKMLQGDARISDKVQQFEDKWIAAAKAPSRPKAGEMATRPGYGTKGKPLVVRANYFDLELNPKIKFHSYIAKISPEPKPNRHLLQIWDHILAISKIAQAGAASDRASELVTLQDLGDVPTLTVNIPDGDRDRKAYTVKLTANGVIDHQAIITRLRDLDERGANPDEAIMVRLLNILMAAHPGKDGGITTLGKGGNNKFYWIDRRKQFQSLPGGLECLRGYYASVRLAAGRVLLNLSVNHSAFYRAGPLIELWEAFVAIYGADRPLFARYVKTLRVQCTHLKDDIDKKGKVPRVKTIWGVAEKDDGKDEVLKPEVTETGADAYNVKFYMDKRKISVAQYFKEKYNLTLKHGDKPVLNVGNKSKPVYLPMDVLVIPEGRVFRGELSTTQRQGIIGFSCRVPSQNYDSIIDHGLEIVGAKGDHTKSYGIRVLPNMLAVPARILSPPTLKYSGSKQAPTEGQWNLRGKIFTTGAKVDSWAGVVMSTGPPPRGDALVDFRKFESMMNQCGMKVKGLIQNVLHIRLDMMNQRDNLAKVDDMFAKLKQRKVDLAVIVMPLGMERVFDHIKWRGDTMKGVVTHCCNTKKFFVDKDNSQYWANNAMKVNLRLGGVNQVLDMPASSPLIAAGKTMVVGLDVTHPSPTDPETFPSIASIVASTNATLGQWPGQVKIQERRVENVVDLAELLKTRLHRWKKDNKNALPENILIFRDGVSEGQYDMVLNDELVKVKKGCQTLYPSEKQPNVTILVGGKRHNTRFFPTKSVDMDRKANCRNGLVVDRVITRPHLWDFYLQAQAPLQGSARSAHYVVIWDEIFVNPSMRSTIGNNPTDAIQELTHNICYMMGRCTRSISYSTPAFLADRFADRARKYVRAYYFEHQVVRGNFRPAAPQDSVTRLAPDLSETMVYI